MCFCWLCGVNKANKDGLNPKKYILLGYFYHLNVIYYYVKVHSSLL
jgi:hypothetical protein